MSGPAANGRRLSAEHRRRLAERYGLLPETIKALGFFTERDPEAFRKALAWDHPPGPGELLPAIGVPYFEPDGSAASLVRYRPDRPRLTPDGKPVKYEQPRGGAVRAYLPARARAVLGDPAAQLLITEGEFKAACADQHNIPCVGLGGVWMFRDGGGQLLPELRAVKWAGRPVVIAFDSDMVYKPEIQQAQKTLADLIQREGAAVRVLFLPQPGREKIGLDDFIVRHGPNALRDLLYDATLPPPMPEAKGVVTNYFECFFPREDDKPPELKEVPKAPDIIARTVLEYCGGWPKAVGRNLVVPSRDGRPVYLKKPADLTAFVRTDLANRYGGATARVRLKKDQGGKGFVDEAGLFAAAPDLVERFGDASPLPHQPPVPDVCYLPFRADGGDGRDLQLLLSLFTPYSAVDASLIRAFWLTLFWGGPGGRRPMFLFTGPPDDPDRGVGVGKSTIPELAALLLGGSVEIGQDAGSVEDIKRRMLSGDSAGLRLVRLDNLKTHRFSWGEFEGLITSDLVSGHRMYHGHAARPNLFTYAVTLNGASLSADIATRVLPVRLARPRYVADWRGRVEGHIRARRHAIIGDILAALRAPAQPLRASNYSRWGEWEAAVLARVPDPDGCREAVAARQLEFNVDREQAERLRQQFRHTLALLGIDPAKSSWRFSTQAVCEVYRAATNTSAAASAVSNELALANIPELRKADAKGQRFWGWTGARYESPDAKAKYQGVIDFDRKGQSTEGYRNGFKAMGRTGSETAATGSDA